MTKQELLTFVLSLCYVYQDITDETEYLCRVIQSTGHNFDLTILEDTVVFTYHHKDDEDYSQLVVKLQEVTQQTVHTVINSL